MLGIGIDTGGTCTDAVIYDFETGEILGAGKALTTPAHLETGIANALDQLPAQLLQKAERIALSTTLATNACLENRGARAKLLMLGFDWEMIGNLRETYASYGLKDFDRLVVMEAKAEGIFTEPFDPDWEHLKKTAREQFEDCESIGIVQKYARANGARFELTARQILQEQLDTPLTLSYNISNETDILKTCAGTMLNARLIPIVARFMEAVHHVMAERNLSIPVMIVRSDGTMMSEEMTKSSPVETILCGPAASVVGGSALAGAKSGIIVDMGGTTTDIAIIKNREPVLAKGGIQIGQWKTMVAGLFVQTFGLGGDSAVRQKDGTLLLDTLRVIPLSVLAQQCSHVLPDLKRLLDAGRIYDLGVYEFLVLQKDISGKKGYTREEQAICRHLMGGPVMLADLARAMDTNPRYLPLMRLEEDGVILRSGLTPTDMMILKGDFDAYDGAAARVALDFFVKTTPLRAEKIPDLVYDLVVERMYMKLGTLLLQQQYPRKAKQLTEEYLKPLLECCYAQAKEALTSPAFAQLSLRSDYPLIGVGAPIHVFLPRVARLLGTRAIIPAYAGVANALGAVASRASARFVQLVRVIYEAGAFKQFEVAAHGQIHTFDHIKKKEPAVACAKEALQKRVDLWAKNQQLPTAPKVTWTVEENRLYHRKDGLLLEIKVTALASEA